MDETSEEVREQKRWEFQEAFQRQAAASLGAGDKRDAINRRAMTSESYGQAYAAYQTKQGY